SEKRRDRDADWNGQRIAGESCGVYALALCEGRYGEHLRGTKDLPEALILAEEESCAAAVVDRGDYNRATDGDAKLVTCERRNSALVEIAFVVEEIAGVESGVADEFEGAAMNPVGARLCDDIGEAGGAVADFRGHYAAAGLHFLNRIDVVVGEGGAPEFG